jgi:hypothetical protein
MKRLAKTVYMEGQAMGESVDKTRPTALTPDQSKRIWEWLLHEDNLFTSRANFMLVAESMLIAAFASLLAADPPHRAQLLVVASVGILVTISWFYTAVLQIVGTLEPIKTSLKQHLPEYGGIASRRKLSVHLVIGGVLPALLICTWLALWVTSA